MKKILLIPLLFVFTLVSAQSLPTTVTKSFDKQFPNQVITSWNDNSYYNYQSDWGDDIYFGDYDYDGFEDPYYGGFMAPYGYGYGYEYDYGFGFPYYGYDREFDVPIDYEIGTEVAPTYYQLHFKMDDSRMSAMFKPDGTFIIAKGRVRTLPSNVISVVKGKFKGQTIRFGGEKEKIIIPNNPVPIYRFKVEVKHAKNHIMKVDANGKVISDEIR